VSGLPLATQRRAVPVPRRDGECRFSSAIEWEVTENVLDVQRVDYVRVPVRDMPAASHVYGEVLGLERVMIPPTHGDEFVPLPAATSRRDRGRRRVGLERVPWRRVQRSGRQPDPAHRRGARAQAT
ncbi:MAG TPA: hypothetical protein VJ689_13285, partial [Gaiellaceae bacterium]|nr:hypothetical protein [Gaiellaceae bacterium]